MGNEFEMVEMGDRYVAVAKVKGERSLPWWRFAGTSRFQSGHGLCNGDNPSQCASLKKEDSEEISVNISVNISPILATGNKTHISNL